VHPSPTTPSAPTQTTLGRAWTALVLICVAEFMLVLDVTAANVALPTIGRDLTMSPSSLPWVLTAYVVAFGGLMLLGGRLADAFGRRRVLIVGLLVFTAASLACGIADSGSQLIAARAAQGVGAALMSPAALSTVAHLFDGERRLRALGAWAAIGASGFVAGLVISGGLASGPGWEWIFFVNVPIGLVLALLLPLVVPPDAPVAERPRVDLAGAALVTAACALLVYGLSSVAEHGWASAHSLVSLAGGVAAGGAFVAVERQLADPLIDPAVLGRRRVRSGLFVMLAATAAMLALFYLVSLYLQHVVDLTPLRTGLVFLPSALAILFSAHAAQHLIARFGIRVTTGGAFATAAVGAGLLIALADPGAAWTVIPGLVVTSLGLGPAFVVATATALADVEDEVSGRVSGIVNTGHEVGGAFGVALVTAAGASSLAQNGDPGAFTDAMTLLAGLLVVAAVLGMLFLPSDRPAATAHGHH
jgi:EmrB/QacA subfamily drug resistance transporter